MNYRKLLTPFIKTHGHQTILDLFAPFIADSRVKKITEVLAQRLTSISIAVESPADPHNAAAIIRSAEAFGLQRVHVICETHYSLAAKNTTKGAFHWVDVDHYHTVNEFCDHVKAQQIKLAGAVMNATHTIHDLPVTAPICLVFGNERRGLSNLLLEQCDYQFRIPMHGMTESLNLSVASAISLYDITERKRAALSTSGELFADELFMEQVIYFARCLPSRLVNQLLQSLTEKIV
ncbi:MAG: RNA methyltransferase [Legionellales bacterium]|nr:RNA methyltransferase [Legionellales bacterium]